MAAAYEKRLLHISDASRCFQLVVINTAASFTLLGLAVAQPSFNNTVVVMGDYF